MLDNLQTITIAINFILLTLFVWKQEGFNSGHCEAITDVERKQRKSNKEIKKLKEVLGIVITFVTDKL